MGNKKKNIKEAEYLLMINEERKKVKEQLEKDLVKIIKTEKSLSNYNLWLNKKCAIMIKTSYIIDTYVKDMKKEGFAEDTVYVLVKKNTGEFEQFTEEKGE